MIGKFKFNQRWIGIAISVLLAVALGLVLYNFRVGARVKQLSYDLLLVWRGEVPVEEAVMVYLDEESHKAMGQQMNRPWDRAIHAQLIDRLTAVGVKAIAFDVVFNEPSTPEADQRFADSLSTNKNVVLAVDNIPIPGQKKGKTMYRPIDLFMDSAAGLGSDEVVADSDMVARSHPPNTPEELLPSLSWATAEFVKAGATQKPGADAVPRWINYYGKPDWIPHFSYHRFFGSNPPPADYLRGKTVFVGARMLTRFAGERKDEFVNPWSFWLISEDDPRRFIPGVEIQTTAFLNLLRGDWLRRLPEKWERFIVLIIGVGFGLALIHLRPLLATGCGLAGCALVAEGSFLLINTNHMWFPWLIIVIQIAAVLLWSIIFNSVQLYVQKRLLEQTLAIYLPPKMVKKHAKDPKFLKPGAEKHMLTILFSDIANFTSITENVDGDELASAMNNYFQSAVSGCIHKTDGTVVKYIGDAIFAFWNAPDQQSDHHVRACEAALLFRHQQPHYIRGKLLNTRIGLHTGVANVGNFGSTERVDYTALGENINLAARMEGLNKYLGTELLITGETIKGVQKQFVTRFVGLFRLKGFEKAVEVYELIATADQADASKAWRESFAEGLHYFQKRNFDAAEAAFRRTLELKAEDGPSKFLLERIADLRADGLPADWRGEIELKEK